MHRFAPILLALALAACTSSTSDGGPSTTCTPDTGADTAARDTAPDTPDQPDAEPDAPSCVCDTDGPCCDGCQAVRVGESCDDGKDCTLGTTCQPDGTCGDPSGSPCDDRLEEPQCQSISCDEVQGCGSVENIREGLPCDDGDPSTKNDTCRDGECVGEPKCQCEGKRRCCDGCMPHNEGKGCDNGNDDTSAVCLNGACADVSSDRCECATTASPCCNGCSWTPGEVCNRKTKRECKESGTSCSPAILIEEQVNRCSRGSGPVSCQYTRDSDWTVVNTKRCTNGCCQVNDRNRIVCK